LVMPMDDDPKLNQGSDTAGSEKDREMNVSCTQSLTSSTISIPEGTVVPPDDPVVHGVRQSELRSKIPFYMPVTAAPMLGSWKCTDISWSYETFLKDIGVPWVARKAAFAVKPTMYFHVKPFTEEEVKKFDRFLAHSDGGNMLGCSYSIGPIKVSEPIVGFEAPATLGNRIKEQVVRKFDGDALVTLRDWSVLRNMKASAKPVPCEMRCFVVPSEKEGKPDKMTEVVTWGAAKKKYHRKFVRVEKNIDVMSHIKGIKPPRPAGQYHTWTESGVTWVQKQRSMSAKQSMSVGICTDWPFTDKDFDLMFDMPGGVTNDWDKLISRNFIRVSNTVPPAMPIAAQCVIKPAFVDHVLSVLNGRGMKDTMKFQLKHNLHAGRALTPNAFQLAYSLDPSMMVSLANLIAMKFVSRYIHPKAVNPMLPCSKPSS
jgi:hypothetical protein